MRCRSNQIQSTNLFFLIAITFLHSCNNTSCPSVSPTQVVSMPIPNPTDMLHAPSKNDDPNASASKHTMQNLLPNEAPRLSKEVRHEHRQRRHPVPDALGDGNSGVGVLRGRLAVLGTASDPGRDGGGDVAAAAVGL